MSGRATVLWLHSCGARHAPGTRCPPLGVWLVAASCTRGCWMDGHYIHYCPTHDTLWAFEERRPRA